MAEHTDPSNNGPQGSADDAAEQALRDAKDAITDIGALAAGAAPVSLPEFSGDLPAHQARTLAMLADVNLQVRIELGRTKMLVEDVLRLGEGAVVELDKLAGDPVDVYVNDRHVARGEVLVLNENFCVRINEIIAPPVEEVGTEAP
jgi:flagellar motor switch protein FliN